MARPLIRPFTEDDVPAAGRLLAAQHARQRQHVPLLDPAYEQPGPATAEAQSAWVNSDGNGTVAVVDGEVVGYLLGAPEESTVWGANLWVRQGWHAVAPGHEEVARDLYGAAAQAWVDAGRTEHYVVLPAGPAGGAALVDAWFRLGFGLQHVHGVREPLPSGPAVAGGARGRDDAAVRVRRPVDDDVPALAGIDLLLSLHHGRSPVFSAGEVGTLEEAAQEWRTILTDPEMSCFVAEHRGRVVGAAFGCGIEVSFAHSGIARPPAAALFAFAAVLPDARGVGAGRVLGEAILRWSGEAGYASCVTDWRATNLLSSRAWPRLGFRDSFWRVHRRIGY